ncbi:hypothetical protein BV22DRAFT_227851 [Leucogyrophana mollusca]|uniref:Uncharacterized protein n=1 Tax=Leucogyrophana mollusca TaxID=85980 RepID=A0ACB8BSD9_9AGAM|nr:hypothetical protein BV22DRAFT_227851 [Leucogyrophana mollusca]
MNSSFSYPMADVEDDKDGLQTDSSSGESQDDSGYAESSCWVNTTLTPSHKYSPGIKSDPRFDRQLTSPQDINSQSSRFTVLTMDTSSSSRSHYSSQRRLGVTTTPFDSQIGSLCSLPASPSQEAPQLLQSPAYRRRSSRDYNLQLDACLPLSETLSIVSSMEDVACLIPRYSHNNFRLTSPKHAYHHVAPAGNHHSTEAGNPCMHFNHQKEKRKQDATGCLPLDFLSDPDPWATIGKILDLEPGFDGSTSQRMDDLILPKGASVPFVDSRCGVGYIKAPSLPASPSGTPECSSFMAMSSQWPPVEDNVPRRSPEPTLLDDIKPLAYSPKSSLLGLTDEDSPSACFSLTQQDGHRCPVVLSTITRSISRLQPNDDREDTNLFDPRLDNSENASPKVFHADARVDVANATSRIPVGEVTYDGPCLFSDSGEEDDE